MIPTYNLCQDILYYKEFQSEQVKYTDYTEKQGLFKEETRSKRDKCLTGGDDILIQI